MTYYKFGLLGYPLSHSVSPALHDIIMKQLDIQGEYHAYAINEHELKSMVEKVRKNELSGLNVTIPYKEKIMRYLDGVSEEAAIIGAVNTLILKHGNVIGHNTDVDGFLYLLNKHHIDPLNKHVYILGSGGAAKAVAYALKQKGAHVSIVSRDPTKGITYSALDTIKTIDMLINATPIGMSPQIDVLPIEPSIIERAHCVIDLIYNPRETAFMKEACFAIGGGDMLIGQAIAAHTLWHGTTAKNQDTLISLCQEVLP